MTSKTFYGIDEFGVPVKPQRIPGLGRTWVKRGRFYWFRRGVFVLQALWATLAMLFMSLAGVAMVHSLKAPLGWSIVMYLGMFVCGLAGGRAGLRALRASRQSTMSPHERKEQARARRRAGRRWWVWVATLPLVILFLLLLPAVGPYLFGLIAVSAMGKAFSREFPEERGARLDLERQRSEHGRW